ncbi:DUF5684 domain-containing protein [Microbacterium sp. CFH 31415]|uniref:DUF5684 domain-containing protein n=1 Tax=Microbacterium sp. CFH 31415 TaxID=2921732 RepID=UPI001F135831|nr:DUF5684 domain-containing protein [Microbacterium sp. CFH 31415]MCH6232037.1 DUF5684 domain-containing protein [Microbacterium sp. CFH 31415]
MNADASATVAGILISLLAVAAVYVWTAIALSAVFRKSGEEAWKAWVPVLNVIVLLQLGGLSPWLVLMALVPVLGGIALWVVVVIACYRVNVAFGYGAGMTVLAALLFPVWATVLGFGSARWVGAEPAPGVRRSVGPTDVPVPGSSPADAGPPPPGDTPAGNAWAPTAPATMRPAPPVPPVPQVPPAPSAPSPDEPRAAPVAAAEEPISFVPVTGASRPVPPASFDFTEPSHPGAPHRPADPSPVLDEESAPAPASSARANQNWGGFDLGAVVELTGEVTAAVSGAPQPIAAVPGVAAERPDEESDQRPAVTRVPAARPTPEVEPWAPARSPLPEGDAFPEASGEVSAVAGAPDAGTPRSARTSVSAQHVLPEIPDGVDETVIANRRKAKWSIVLPSGGLVELAADIVLVGRRPARSTAYPDAQLVVIDDGTVSKTHMRLERNGDEWSVTDLHSTNGTILIASDGAEREIPPGAAHRAPARMLLGDAELRLLADDSSR